MKRGNLSMLVPQSAPVVESWRWGRVVGPGKVLLTGDSSPALVSDSLVELVTGERVLVRLSGSRAVVIGKAGGVKMPVVPVVPEPGSVIIGGRSYRLSGTVRAPSFSFARSDGDVWSGTVSVPVPYTPPSGWTFTWTCQSTTGFMMVSCADLVPVSGVQRLRVVQAGSSSTEALGWLAWQLIKL